MSIFPFPRVEVLGVEASRGLPCAPGRGRRAKDVGMGLVSEGRSEREIPG